MNPFLLLAGSILPEILKLAFGPKASPLVDAVTKAVQKATDTEDPDKAKKTVEENPKIADDLRLELARIAAQGEVEQHKADIEELKLTIEREVALQKVDLDRLKLAFERDAGVAKENLDNAVREDADRQNARGMFLNLASARNPLAWAPFVISVIIVCGFFWILWTLLQPIQPGVNSPLARDQPVFQLINMVVGGLVAAFATVVSYFLGSSVGSRAKDTASFELQSEQARQTRESVRAQSRQSEEIAIGGGKPPEGGRPASQTEQTEAAANRFLACLEVVFGGEGGFSNDKFDPGGATKFGITIRTLGAYRGDDVTVDDVKNLTKEEARDIYRSMYWNVMKCEQLPPGIDLVVFDHGVNAGPGRAAKILQNIVGTATDGSIGPVTLEAVRRRDAADVVRRYSQARRDFYEGLDNDRFERGWINRANKVEQVALGMASARKAA